ncbi:MAG: exopolysaccharide biosynthesis polyprenyl glycosylphosphotransferase [bacterium]|nr:exopolysaccharide biosynthesis polyprenyl glycosylphosphotransferase [bacterium]
MKNSSSLVYAFILLIGDFMALMSAFVLAYILRVKYDDRPLPQQVPAETYFLIFAVLLVFWLMIFALLGLYNGRVYENRFSEAGRILAGCFIGILFLIGAEYVISRPIFPARLVPVYGLGLSFLMVLLFRTISRGVKHTLYSYGIGLNHVLLVGATDITKELAERLSYPESGFKVLGIVGDKRTRYEQVAETHQFANFEEAVSALRHTTLHSIVQTELFTNQTENEEILGYAQQNHIAYRFVPGNSRMFVGNIDVDLFQNIPVVAVHQTSLIGWGRVTKRLFDITISLILIVLLSPLFILITLSLLLSGGQVIYRRKRLTRFNEYFTIYKFRSMKKAYNGMDPEQGFAKMGRPELAKKFRENGDYLPKDPRISLFGRFLRNSSLDELPQLFNILRGDISFVGPRALIEEELDKSKHKHNILSVKSGLTGLAQISGRKDISFEERRKLDMYYVQHWSFWMDLVIVLKTAVHVLLRLFKNQSD